MAAIGHVCLQWSLFEHTVLYIIYSLEGITYHKGDIIYGGLDWRPRLNMAINLCVHYEAPKPLINRLKELRKKIDKDKLADRRNTAVHGVQRRGENEGEVIMTMPRVPGENKHTTLTAIQIGALANEIVAIQREADSIFREIGDWKFGEHNSEDSGRNIT